MKRSILLAGLFVLAALPALAQVPVVESGFGQNRPSGSAAAGGGNDLLLSLYNQLEALQQEVQTLRGMVEEQSFRLQRLETETRNRYLDIDSRLSELSPAAAAASPGSAAPVAAAGVDAGPAALRGGADAAPARFAGGSVPPAPAGRNVAEVPGVLPPPPAAAASPEADAAISQMSEDELYRTALSLLLDEGKSADSAAMFQAFVQRFPQGRLLPNALYWQGEALILLSRYPEARAAFERVLIEFPGDGKAAGAMLKTGVVQNLMGNRSEAERIWRELPTRFPESASEINLARDYLSRP